MMWMLVVLLSVLLLNSAAFAKEKKTNQDKKEKSLSVKKENLLVLTVATDETDGFRRFMRSAKRYKHNVTVLGMGEEWQGGDMSYAGGGHKIVLLKEAMKKYKDIKDLVVMFVDSYDVVITAGAEAILGAFLKFKAGAVFSTEGFCWPDASLAEKYPVVKMNEKRYLNSGGFIGYAPDVFSIVDKFQGNPTDDDQLFYTQVFLDEPFRTKLNIKLDTRGEIFQNLHGALDEVQIKFKGASSYMYNTKSGNTPMVIHGNGPITVEFNNLANYLADQWTPTVGCQVCKEDIISLKKVKHEDYPQVVVAIFIEQPTPFVEDFLQHIGELNYPKKKIDLFIHYADEFHKNDTEKFVSEMKQEYNSITVYGPKDEFSSWTARNRGLDECTKRNCQYYFSLDATAHLEDPLVLQSLIERNRSVIAPLLVRPSKMWSNFWGALSNDGFYKRSDDYLEIVQKSRQGVWVVPYINDAYLIHGNLIKSLKGGYIFEEMDPDMAICRRMREKGIFMYIDNMDYYGHLVDFEQFETSHWRNDLFNIFVNKYTWEKKYLHVDYNTSLDKNSSLLQPCPDVYWFPIVTRKFCRHLVEELEHYGQWSGGRNEDPRLAGGYENVPTVDIHMSQLGFEKQWLRLLKDYIVPLQIRAFPGYYSEGRSVMNFAVRYHPQEQDHLRPHHDSSTFTINIALNRAHIDYEGGGCHFIRYNCSVQDTKMGWMLMHPGRLTHYHEGLRVTKGVRYIMISFVDP